MPEHLDLLLLQTSPRLGDPTASAAGMRDLAASAGKGAERTLLIAPELALTGYDLRDRAEELAVRLDQPEALRSFDLPEPLLLGLPEAAPDGRIYNAAALLEGGAIRFVHRKLYLPTYGMFDEARYFAAGARLRTAEHRGWRLGVLVCEDFWHPGLVYALAAAGIDALIVLAAAPGRGVWQGGDSGPFASWDDWPDIARTCARLYGIYVVLVNRAGAEEGVAFAGGSLVVAPDGALDVQGPPMDEAVVHARLERERLRRARRPYWHRRDDDPRVVIEALGRARS